MGNHAVPVIGFVLTKNSQMTSIGTIFIFGWEWLISAGSEEALYNCAGQNVSTIQLNVWVAYNFTTADYLILSFTV